MLRLGIRRLPNSVTLLGALLIGATRGAELFASGDEVSAAIKQGLPRYDPAVRANLPGKAESTAASNDGAVAYGARANDVAPAETKPGATKPAVTNPEAALALPRMTVRGSKDGKPEPALQLPRIVVRPPAKDVRAEGFETPAARDERLVKKHLTVFDRVFLNRFTLPLFGIPKEERAREAEAVAQTARQLDEVATLLEIAQEEQGDSEEAKKLKELYRELFMARPMGTQREPDRRRE